MRKLRFTSGEYYHVYNRGVDKRDIFIEQEDLERFYLAMQEFNVLNPIGSIHSASFHKKHSLRNLVPNDDGRLVNFIAFCLNPNHYHFILQQVNDRGLEKFMHRVGVGYSNYFNKKYKRVGSLFQGTFKATHVNSDEYLLHASVYVNLNYKVHQIDSPLVRSSWKEYDSEGDYGFCKKGVILSQFRDKDGYKDFAKTSLENSLRRKEFEKTFEA